AGGADGEYRCCAEDIRLVLWLGGNHGLPSGGVKPHQGRQGKDRCRKVVRFHSTGINNANDGFFQKNENVFLANGGRRTPHHRRAFPYSDRSRKLPQCERWPKILSLTPSGC